MKKIIVSSLFIFVMQNAWAVLYTNNIENGCVPNIIHYFNNTAYMTARWTPNSHTCNVNQFLPANIDGCVSCPMGQTCTGGTFDFNETQTQGITYTTPIMYNQNNSCVNELLKPDGTTSYMVAKFVPNVHNCSAGYYLPANVDSCTICPQNNKCTGGTYTFNETTAQGIEPCPSSAQYAPAGSSVCYPHLMHLSSERPNDVIYLKSTATTTPAFNIDMNNDGIADVFANMTTTRTPMTSVSEHYLKIMVNGVLYYVCDDTSCPGAN